MKNTLFEFSRKLFSIMAKGTIKDATRSVQQELLAAQPITTFTTRYFPYTIASFRPSCLITIINDTIISREIM